MASEPMEWIRGGQALVRRSMVSGAKWHEGVLYVHLQGGEKFISLKGKEAEAVWRELVAGTVDLVTGELAPGGEL